MGRKMIVSKIRSLMMAGCLALCAAMMTGAVTAHAEEYYYAISYEDLIFDLDYGSVVESGEAAAKYFTLSNSGSVPLYLNLTRNFSYDDFYIKVVPIDEAGDASEANIYVFCSEDESSDSEEVEFFSFESTDVMQPDLVILPDETLAFKVGVNKDLDPGQYSVSYVFSKADDPEADTSLTVNAKVTVEEKTPVVTGVVVSPSEGTAQAGYYYQFSAEVDGEHLADKSVTWSVTGNKSDNTYMSRQSDTSAILAIGSDESASSLTITATSVQDPAVAGKVNISVQKAAFYIRTLVSDYDAGTVTDSKYVEYGDSFTITAKANTGFVFRRFTENGEQISTSSSIQLSNINSDREITAEFERSKYTITATVSPTGAGRVENTGSYEYGEQVWLRAVPADGYDFTGWVLSGQSVSTDEEYLTNALAANMTITANFKKQEARKIAIASGAANQGGRISPDGETLVEEGKSTTFKMTPDSGYRVHAVAVDGVIVGAPESYTFSSVYEEHSIAVSFEKIPEEELNQSTTRSSSGGQTGDSQDSDDSGVIFSDDESLMDDEEEELARKANEAENTSGDAYIVEHITQDDAEHKDAGTGVAGESTFTIEDEHTAKAASADGLLDSTGMGKNGSTNAPYISLPVIRIVVGLILAVVFASIIYTYYWLYRNRNRNGRNE